MENEEIKTKKNMKTKKPKKVKRKLALLIVIVLSALIIPASYYFSGFESTDDAFIEGRIVRISPKVSGIISKLHVEDNQHVKKGDLLLEIDNRDYKVKTNQAKARYEASIYKQKSAKADLKAADTDLNNARADFERFEDLYKKGAVSKQDYERSQTKYEAAKASVTAANEAIFSHSKNKVADAELKQLETSLEQAELELSYTKIYAVSDGTITNRSAEAGAFIHTGAPLFSLVPDERWIVANFKETQLERIKSGQEVLIKIDAYPKVKFMGVVDSIQSSTGSKTSLFPPENAVGSFVKIVQRVPVKIRFNDKLDDKYVVAPGMSVIPRIKVR